MASVNPKKLIVVFGATGHQGSSVVNYLLNDHEKRFKVRAITRNPESQAAKALLRRGVEVVKADLREKESLEAAFKGAHGVFLVTQFFQENCFDPEKEAQETKNAGEAAKAAGVKHFVHSTLESTMNYKEIPMIDKWRVPHFDGKALGNQHLKDLKLPLTSLYPSFYAENLLESLAPRKDGDTYFIDVPMEDKPLPIVVVKELGGFVREIFADPEKYIGQDVGAENEHLTIPQLAIALSKATGKNFEPSDMDWQTMKQQKFEGADDLGNMFYYFQLANEPFVKIREKGQKELFPERSTIYQWAVRHKNDLFKTPKEERSSGR